MPLLAPPGTQVRAFPIWDSGVVTLLVCAAQCSKLVFTKGKKENQI